MASQPPHLSCYSVSIIQQIKSTNCVTDWSLDANYSAIPKDGRNQPHLPAPQIAINRAFAKICASRLPLWQDGHAGDAPCWSVSFETASFRPEFSDLRVSAPSAIVRFVDAKIGHVAPAMRYHLTRCCQYPAQRNSPPMAQRSVAIGPCDRCANRKAKPQSSHAKKFAK